MSQALINKEIVRWAADRARVSTTELAQAINVKVEKVSSWLSGESRPSFKQAQKISNALRIPFGYLYLIRPPEEPLPIPDLRTIGDQTNHAISPDLRDVLYDVLRKQNWYREYLTDQEAEQLSFIGKYDLNTTIDVIAGDITETLKLSISNREEAGNWETFLRLLIDKAETAGIWVMRTGVVGNNTRRPLSVEEFRGFAISDALAPLVFVNGKDARAAQIFTLIHELVHLWIGESGISDVYLGAPKGAEHHRTEQFCNAVAAEVLVPEELIRRRWNVQVDLAQNAEALAHYFRVSAVMAARRALDLNLVRWTEFIAFYQAQVEIWRRIEGGGGDYYRNVRVRNGRRFTEAVLHSFREGRLLLRDAGHLLNVNPSKFGRLSKVPEAE